jgi:serine/threonine protein kinase
MMHYALSTNSHLKQNYIPVLILGYGGCGIVFEALDSNVQERVAIKIIYKSTSKTSIPSEVNILSRLNHTNIVKFKYHFEDSKAHYLVMEKFGKEWCRGDKVEELVLVMPPGYSNLTVISGTSSSLFEYIDYNKTGRVPSRSLKPLFKQIASSVAYLHKMGIVHGDIKEENVLIGMKGGRLVAKICDFGHSYVVDSKNPRMKLYGTRVLTPPELLNHLRYEHNSDYYCDDPYQFGYKQDIWALGIVLWTMIHGSLPPENDFFINGEYDLSEYKYYPTSFATVKDPSKGFINLVCLDLLKSMLIIDPDERISAARVIRHAYFC